MQSAACDFERELKEVFVSERYEAHASAVIYSIIQTAKENDLHPFSYLTWLFERLPNVNVGDPSLLPHSDFKVGKDLRLRPSGTPTLYNSTDETQKAEFRVLSIFLEGNKFGETSGS